MTVVSTLDITGLTPVEYRAVLDRMGVEAKPSPGIYLHVATPTDSGFRIMEIWDQKSAFGQFIESRMSPASKELGIDHKTDVAVSDLHNLFAPRLDEIPRMFKTTPPGIVSTMDVKGLLPREFRALLDEMGVEQRPEPGIHLHVTHATPDGFRIVELWDTQKNFEAFAERRLVPATKKLKIERPTTMKFTPIHNLFAPRLHELPGLIPSLPGGPGK